MSLSFQYVYIPADATIPLEERTMVYSKGEEIEVLTRNLQEHFKGGVPGFFTIQFNYKIVLKYLDIISFG